MPDGPAEGDWEKQAGKSEAAAKLRDEMDLSRIKMEEEDAFDSHASHNVSLN